MSRARLSWPPKYMLGAQIGRPRSHSLHPQPSPPTNHSPQGSVLHRWVCSDTLVRLKSQTGFINSCLGNADTPFHLVTNSRINRPCPGVLQNYISSYVIKSDWPHSAFPLRSSEITVCICGSEEQTPSPWWKQRWHEMLLKWLGTFPWQTRQCLRARPSCWWWCEERRSGRERSGMAAGQ